MNNYIDLLNEVLNFVVSVGCFDDGSSNTDHCPGSVLHPITAALATQGYWIQADILWHLRFTGFQIWAILIYLFACIGGIVGMAFGAPPKLWLWLLFGPGIFFFLIDTTTPAYGVRWYVGPNSSSGGDTFGDTTRESRAMKKVWKLAEVGLRNSSLAMQSSSNSWIGSFLNVGGGDVEIYNDGHPTGQNRSTEYDGDGGQDGSVRVAWVFVWIDGLFSDLVEWLVWWTGIFNSGAPASDITRSNLPPVTISTSSGLSFLTGQDTDENREDDQAWMLSKNKWSYLMDITGAQLHNGDLRDSFVTLLSSECGDALRRGINESAYIAAGSAKGLNLPATVFKSDTEGRLYGVAVTELTSTHIPTPPAVQALFESDGVGSFRNSLSFLSDEERAREWMDSGIMDTIACDQLLSLVVEGFRWESAHIYYQLLTSLPPEMSPLTLMYTLFYGWDLRQPVGGTLAGVLGWDYNSTSNVGLITPIVTPVEQAEFIQNLIFVHLIRNELQLAPKPFRGRMNEGGKATQSVETYQSRTGSRNKYGEVHTWSQMIPYIQGVLFYLLAMAYPFVCMMILIPGNHKALFTWLSFFFWAKLWDIGFAVVMVLERSIWAMLGNGSNTSRVFSRVIDMKEFGDYQVKCPEGAAGGLLGLDPPYGLCAPGIVPDVVVGADGDPTQTLFIEDIMKYFDQGLTVGANLQLDLANSYYIYIMSALYFAVPAVTGQMVLGAKAGAAGLASGAIGGLAGESGKAAGQGYVAEQSRIGGNNNGMVGFNERAKAMGEGASGGGFAQNALKAGNSAAMSDLYAGAANLGNNLVRGDARAQSLGASNTMQGNSIEASQWKATTAPTMAGQSLLNSAAGDGGGIKKGGDAVYGALAATGARSGAELGFNSIKSDSMSASSGSSGSTTNSNSQKAGQIDSNPSNNKVSPTPSLSKTDQAGNAANAFNQHAGASAEMKNAAVTANSNGKQLGYEMVQAQFQTQGAGHSMDSAIAKRAGEFQGQFAEAHAGMQSYSGSRDFQSGAAEYLGAIGGNANVVSGASGSLPNQMTGLAGMGMLGQTAAQQARRGGAEGDSTFSKAKDGMLSSIERSYGFDATRNTYNNSQGEAQQVSQAAGNKVAWAGLSDSKGADKAAKEVMKTAEPGK
jgi:hypothetical protein